MQNLQESFLFRCVAGWMVICFLVSGVLPSGAYAQALNLPAPGVMVSASPAFVPVIIKGLQVHPDNPLLFDFMIDTGKSGIKIDSAQFKAESQKLVKYFLASLTVKEDDQWVNLSPYERDRMIPAELGGTELGRDMLAQDYILKQLTASLIYPEKALGKTFWDRVYAQVREKFGDVEVPVDTFNKVWIVADQAKVLERNNAAYIIGAHLKVMLETDYLATSMNAMTNVPMPTGGHDAPPADLNERGFVSPSRLPTPQPKNVKATQVSTPTPTPQDEIAKNVLREIVIPILEKEVNEGQNFAILRQMFYSMILASWYKVALKEALLNQVYTNKAKTAGVLADDPAVKEKIYEQYLQAYKKGVFNYIKEETDAVSQELMPRKYFSGGLRLGTGRNLSRVTDANNSQRTEMKIGDMAGVTVQMGASDASQDNAGSSERPIDPVFAKNWLDLERELREVDHLLAGLSERNIRKAVNGKIWLFDLPGKVDAPPEVLRQLARYFHLQVCEESNREDIIFGLELGSGSKEDFIKDRLNGLLLWLSHYRTHQIRSQVGSLALPLKGEHWSEEVKAGFLKKYAQLVQNSRAVIVDDQEIKYRSTNVFGDNQLSTLSFTPDGIVITFKSGIDEGGRSRRLDYKYTFTREGVSVRSKGGYVGEEKSATISYAGIDRLFFVGGRIFVEADGELGSRFGQWELPYMAPFLVFKQRRPGSFFNKIGREDAFRRMIAEVVSQLEVISRAADVHEIKELGFYGVRVERPGFNISVRLDSPRQELVLTLNQSSGAGSSQTVRVPLVDGPDAEKLQVFMKKQEGRGEKNNFKNLLGAKMIIQVPVLPEQRNDAGFKRFVDEFNGTAGKDFQLEVIDAAGTTTVTRAGLSEAIQKDFERVGLDLSNDVELVEILFVDDLINEDKVVFKAGDEQFPRTVEALMAWIQAREFNGFTDVLMVNIEFSKSGRAKAVAAQEKQSGNFAYFVDPAGTVTRAGLDDAIRADIAKAGLVLWEDIDLIELRFANDPHDQNTADVEPGKDGIEATFAGLMELIVNSEDERNKKVRRVRFKLSRSGRAKAKKAGIENSEWLTYNVDAGMQSSVAARQDLGGIDLNARKMGLDVAREGRGINMKFDPAMIAQFQNGDFAGVSGVILRIVPIQDPLLIMGLVK
ncbi:MAG: hypothetical protein HQL20_08260 [Candidatus Omnitrophica bacterium]|nr:hypothetical protein [Candidatus Omnitrophota bacterium]